MRAKARRFSVVALTVAGLVSLAACGGGSSGNGGGGGGGGGTPTPSSNGLTIYPSTASVPVGGTADFTGYVPSSPTSAITWAVAGGSGNGTITGAGVYTAPASAPSPAQVAVTATSGNFSATAVVTVTAAQGLAVSPAAASVLAGTVTPFAATMNGAAAAGVTWEVNGTAGGDAIHGTIDVNGNYTAPLTPPPGGSTVVTATAGGNAGTSTVTVVFSSLSLSGPYSFSYSGADSTTGFLLVAGNFTASPIAGTDGGTIAGTEDSIDGNSLQTGAQISGTFTVGPDGRGTVNVSTGETWQFALANTEHALLINFNTGVASGSGTIDQLFTTTLPLARGQYVFQVSGLDINGNPVGIAGAFSSLGNGALALAGNVLDMNDSGAPNGSITTDDTTLTGLFSLNPGNLTGTLTLTSTDLGVLTTPVTGTAITSVSFDFYVASNNHIRLIETDSNAFLAGDIFLAPNVPGGGYTGASLQKGNYAFTLGGVAGNGPYSAGGVLISSGPSSATASGGSITGGVFDNNGSGITTQSDAAITATSYGVDPTTGRVTSSTTTSRGTFNWVGYVTAPIPVDPTDPNSAVQVQVLLLETDPNLIASGAAYLQSTTSQPSGSYALNLTGQATGATGGEQDVLAQLGITGTTITGSMDINNFALGTSVTGLNVASGSSTIVSTDAHGRGTATFTAAGGASFPVAYYVVDQNTAVMIETDGARVMTGLLMKQY
jgi:hypothetical protein